MRERQITQVANGEILTLIYFTLVIGNPDKNQNHYFWQVWFVSNCVEFWAGFQEDIGS